MSVLNATFSFGDFVSYSNFPTEYLRLLAKYVFQHRSLAWEHDNYKIVGKFNAFTRFPHQSMIDGIYKLHEQASASCSVRIIIFQVYQYPEILRAYTDVIHLFHLCYRGISIYCVGYHPFSFCGGLQHFCHRLLTIIIALTCCNSCRFHNGTQ